MRSRLLFLGCIVFNSFADDWKNWSGNLICNPERIINVSTLKDIQQIILKAAQEKKTVRAVGSRHSWTDILCTEGYLLNTDGLNRILKMDYINHQVCVQAGIKLSELVNYLAKHGFALANQPSVLVQSVAGVIATATHGTGKTGSMADFVTALELVTAEGTVLALSPEEDEELFGAALVNLGSLGVVYSVTLQCVPLYKVRYSHFSTTWSEIIKSYKQLLNDHDFFMFTYYFDTDSVVVDIWDKTEDAHSKTPYFVAKNFIKKVYNDVIYYFNCLLSKNGQLKEIALDKLEVQYGYQALSGEPSPFYLEEEIAIDQALLPQAFKEVADLIHLYRQKGMPIYSIICRFVQADRYALLSPCAGRDVVFFNVSTPNKVENSFYRDYYNLMLKFKGRPHWGKINYLEQEAAAFLYGKNYDSFVGTRKKLDPEGLFSNKFSVRVFGW